MENKLPNTIEKLLTKQKKIRYVSRVALFKFFLAFFITVILLTLLVVLLVIGGAI